MQFAHSKFNAQAAKALVIDEKPADIISGRGRVWVGDLIGWNQGKVTAAEWLDAGGPLDATEHLPLGGVTSWESSSFNCRTHSGSVLRPGALA